MPSWKTDCARNSRLVKCWDITTLFFRASLILAVSLSRVWHARSSSLTHRSCSEHVLRHARDAARCYFYLAGVSCRFCSDSESVEIRQGCESVSGRERPANTLRVFGNTTTAYSLLQEIVKRACVASASA